MLLVILPSLSILLLCVSTWLMIKAVKKQANTINLFFLILSVIFLFSLIIITIYFSAMGDLTFVPFWIYWILIGAGVITGIFSFVKKYVPGQMMSAGLFLFTGFVALFTIGIILLVLSVIQFIFGIVNWERYGLETE